MSEPILFQWRVYFLPTGDSFIIPHKGEGYNPKQEVVDALRIKLTENPDPYLHPSIADQMIKVEPIYYGEWN